MKSILLVNPHLQFQSEFGGRSSLPRSREYLLNMGLLSLATYIQACGHNVNLIDTSMTDYPYKDYVDALYEYHPTVIGISNQSCYSYQATKKFADMARVILPDCKIVVGGLHAGGLAKTLLDEYPSIDIVVVGEGEIAMQDIINGVYNSPCTITPYGRHLIISGTRLLDMNEVPPLDYRLYPSYKKFVPYVEESRGCVAGCVYCTSPVIHKRIRIKPPEELVSDVALLRSLYGNDGFHFYMEANNFGVNHRKVDKLCSMMDGTGISWRTESRCDTFPIHLVDNLVDSGMRVLDIGLESGSHEMLLRMNKTKAPSHYFNRCIDIAEAIAKNDRCLLKLNVMLYYGETRRTIQETRAFIQYLAGIGPIAIGVGPVNMYPGTKMFDPEFDFSWFKGTFWDEVHSYPLNLSNEVSFDDASTICMEIAQEFQTSRTYFEAKRHSQLRYDITYEEFMKESEDVPPALRQLH